MMASLADGSELYHKDGDGGHKEDMDHPALVENYV
jgi:hypothetical protein